MAASTPSRLCLAFDEGGSAAFWPSRSRLAFDEGGPARSTPSRLHIALDEGVFALYPSSSMRVCQALPPLVHLLCSMRVC